ncbi:hypothetical protein HYS00_03365, partial [Candidatus Microgenomates bacterium]|nr:hypothetical protein [Candidatus Microgenomates bacterium]
MGTATDIVTLNLDTTEIADTTFGSGSGFTWTFDSTGGTDPTAIFGSNQIQFTAGTASFSTALGIGTTAPVSALHVMGDSTISFGSALAGKYGNITGSGNSLTFSNRAGSFNFTDSLSGLNAVQIDSSPGNDMYMGPSTYSSASSLTGRINGSGGSGTNIAGAALYIAGGKGTGNAAGGAIQLQTADAGASG